MYMYMYIYIYEDQTRSLPFDSNASSATEIPYEYEKRTTMRYSVADICRIYNNKLLDDIHFYTSCQHVSTRTSDVFLFCATVVGSSITTKISAVILLASRTVYIFSQSPGSYQPANEFWCLFPI
jgi:uncharacterized protein (UPF0333 family)